MDSTPSTQNQTVDFKTEQNFALEVMSVLTGTKPVPDVVPEMYIKDRSISPMENQRSEAITYIKTVVPQLGFSAEIQEWDGKPTIIQKGVYHGAEFVCKYRNVVITVPGTLREKDQQVMVVGAHHDTQNSWSPCWHGKREKDSFLATPGADDNTSGVIGCLTLLYRIKQKKISLKNTLRIVLFDGEEPGIANKMCTGSGHYVASLSAEDKKKINLMINIDMIGGPPTVPEIGIVISAGTDVPIYDLIETVANIPGEIPITFAHDSMNSDLSCLSLSDSARFDSAGIPTILLCNVAGYSTTPSFYHTEEDKMEILDWPTFFRSVDIAEGFLVKMNC